MSANNSESEILALATIEFGKDSNALNRVTTLQELVDELLAVARNNLNRAVEIRTFMDLHGLVALDRNNELRAILAQKRIRDTRDKQYSDDEFGDWSDDQRR